MCIRDSHCSLAVSRGPDFKYVQFAASSKLYPPILFDLRQDSQQVHNPVSYTHLDSRSDFTCMLTVGCARPKVLARVPTVLGVRAK